MGVLSRGILGGFRGKVGPVIGSSWKGIDVMKSKPLSVANPRTPAQTAQRNAFSGVVALASAILVGIVKPLWDRFAQQESGFNAFISANIGNFNSTGIISNFPGMVFSRGKLDNIEVTSAAFDASDANVTILWNTTGGFPDDMLYFVAIRESDQAVLTARTVDERSVGSSVLPISTPMAAGETIHYYFMARKADGTEVSDSTATSTTVVA